MTDKPDSPINGAAQDDACNVINICSSQNTLLIDCTPDCSDPTKHCNPGGSTGNPAGPGSGSGGSGSGGSGSGGSGSGGPGSGGSGSGGSGSGGSGSGGSGSGGSGSGGSGSGGSGSGGSGGSGSGGSGSGGSGSGGSGSGGSGSGGSGSGGSGSGGSGSGGSGSGGSGSGGSGSGSGGHYQGAVHLPALGNATDTLFYTGVDADAENRIICGGRTVAQGVIHRFNQDFSQADQAIISGGGRYYVLSVTAGDNNEIYALVQAKTPGSSFCLVRFDSNLVPLDQYSLSSGISFNHRTIWHKGHLYMASTFSFPGTNLSCVLKLDANLQLLDCRVLTSDTAQLYARGLTVSAEGNLYVTGSIYISNGKQENACIAKLDNDLNVLQLRCYQNLKQVFSPMQISTGQMIALADTDDGYGTVQFASDLSSLQFSAIKHPRGQKIKLRHCQQDRQNQLWFYGNMPHTEPREVPFVCVSDDQLDTLSSYRLPASTHHDYLMDHCLAPDGQGWVAGNRDNPYRPLLKHHNQIVSEGTNVAGVYFDHPENGVTMEHAISHHNTCPFTLSPVDLPVRQSTLELTNSNS